MRELKREFIFGVIFTLISIIYLIVVDETVRFFIFMGVAMCASSVATKWLMESEEDENNEQSEFLQDYKRTARGRTASR